MAIGDMSEPYSYGCEEGGWMPFHG